MSANLVCQFQGEISYDRYTQILMVSWTVEFCMVISLLHVLVSAEMSSVTIPSFDVTAAITTIQFSLI